MIDLRPYQEKMIQSVREQIKQGKKRLVLCAPTGSGKTVMFSYLVSEHAKRGGNILIFTHRTELLKQAGGTFDQFGIDAEYIVAGKESDLTKNIHISMIETFNRRIEKYKEFLQSKTLIIIDEAHLDNFTKIFPYINKNTIVIGATATPERKGKQSDLSEFYEDIVQELDTPDLIQLGFLSDAKSYGVKIETKGLKKVGEDYDTSSYYEENKIYEGVVFNWEKICKNQKTILFASNVESSIRVKDEFLSKGYNARHIDGNTPKAEREEILKWFDQNDDAIICNCGILTAGFDQKDIKCVILYRATTSLPLFLQMCGRGSRVTEDKNEFFILDFGNNIRRLNNWEAPRNWTIYKKKQSNKEGLTPKKECQSCNAILNMSVMVCPYCGKEQKKTKEQEKNEIAELKLLPKYELNSMANKGDLLEKVRLCKAGLVNAFYILHKMESKKDAYEFCRLMGYKDGFIQVNKHRFKIFQ